MLKKLFRARIRFRRRARIPLRSSLPPRTRKLFVVGPRWSHKRRFPIAEARAPTLPKPTYKPKNNLRGLRLYEDRRLHHPLGKHRPPGVFYGGPPQLIVKNRFYSKPGRVLASQTKGRLSFESPNRVLLCVRRNIRKQVMHATGKAGLVGQKKPHRNENSEISCK